METVLAEIHFRVSMLRGFEQSLQGEGIPQEVVEERVKEWLESSGPIKRSQT